MAMKRPKKLLGSRWLLAAPLVLAAMTLYLLAEYEETTRKSDPRMVNSGLNDVTPGFLIHTPGCRIPYMNAFDESIKKYLKKRNPMVCGRKPLIESNQTSIWVVQEALELYNVTAESELKCCWAAFWRKDVRFDKNVKKPDDQIVSWKNCVPFEGSTNIDQEFVKVICKLDDVQIYKDFHAFIVPKESISGSPNRPTSQGPSVLLIGVDAVSRLNFYRQMPRTRALLNSLNAVEMLGYNKVQDNTFPNLVPVLSGNTVEEIEGSCWPNATGVFDNCPWIWKNYSALGFRTGYGEDACWMGLFNYLKSGFYQQPTDYYLRTYIKANEDQIGHTKILNAKLCVGSRFATQILFEYAYKFSANLTFSKVPYWGFFWGSSLTHDYLNVVPDVDEIYMTLLDRLKQEKILDNTIVIFMSDHGIRWGPIRETFQGRVEERLPFLYVLLPEWFRDTYSTAVMNLFRNRRMLTTPFDLHETLKDLLDVSSLKQDAIAERRKDVDNKRGISLFLPVPGHRTCETAGITKEWCTCHQSQSVVVSDTKVQKAAETVVNHLNEILFQYIQCAHLTLKQVKSARVETPDEVVKKTSRDQISDYIIVLETDPGVALFEATVRHVSESDTMTVLGYVSRINIYGNQSKCVLDYRLRLYCYCID